MEKCGNTGCDGYGDGYEQNCSEEHREAEGCCDFKPLMKKTEPVAEVPCSDGVMPQTRYVLHYAGHTISFDAPKAETREQLANVLEKIIERLKAPEDTGEIGFF